MNDAISYIPPPQIAFPDVDDVVAVDPRQRFFASKRRHPGFETGFEALVGTRSFGCLDFVLLSVEVFVPVYVSPWLNLEDGCHRNNERRGIRELEHAHILR